MMLSDWSNNNPPQLGMAGNGKACEYGVKHPCVVVTRTLSYPGWFVVIIESVAPLLHENERAVSPIHEANRVAGEPLQDESKTEIIGG